MGRSNGYRPKKEVREEVMALRAKLATLKDDKWQLASNIMSQITALVGKDGPSRGRIEPRTCKYCGYYGHTRQHCKARLEAVKEREEREIEMMLQEDRDRFDTTEVSERQYYNARTHGQAKTFNELGIPFTLHPLGLGAMVGLPNEKHDGDWTFHNGNVVKNFV